MHKLWLIIACRKKDKNRVRVTAGGNIMDYSGELTTRTADITTFKLMWNSVVSTQNACYMCADTENFYLATSLDRPEYMQIEAKLVPQAFIDINNLSSNVYKGFIYMKIVCGMYGLPQVGILANKLLKNVSRNMILFEVPHTPGLFTHKTRPIWCTLCVDDFGVKYVGKETHITQSVFSTNSITWKKIEKGRYIAE